MEYARELTTFMGGASVVGEAKSEYEFIELIRTGFPAKVLKCVVRSSKLSEEVICSALRIATRTAKRRQATGSRLKASESELIYRFSRVLVTATEVLGGLDKGREWILTENRALGGARPIDHLDTGIGFDDVMELLGRIEHGVYS